MEIVHIIKCEVGDVIRYKTSKKPYIITAKTIEYRLLYSLTQKYKSKADFYAVRIIKGNGKVPENIEELNLILIKVIKDLQDRIQKKNDISKKMKKPPVEIICPEIITTGIEPINYPSFLIPNDKYLLKFENKTVQISMCTMFLDEWKGTLFTHKLGHTKTICYEGKQMFVELVITNLFIKSGWEARQVQTYQMKNKMPRFLDNYIDAPLPSQFSIPIEDKKVKKMLENIFTVNNSSYSGCWDVLGWKDGKIIFVEAKGRGDEIRPTQKKWFCAGLKNGLTPDNFLIVKWDFVS
jgi:hypothetical protein